MIHEVLRFKILEESSNLKVFNPLLMTSFVADIDITSVKISIKPKTPSPIKTSFKFEDEVQVHVSKMRNQSKGSFSKALEFYKF